MDGGGWGVRGENEMWGGMGGLEDRCHRPFPNCGPSTSQHSKPGDFVLIRNFNPKSWKSPSLAWAHSKYLLRHFTTAVKVR
uniref:Uncharacterized protein n=1 Tax=Knipowitschia caucasica TaxID=637954 RepID=A0AAV2JXD7_KNICA